MAVNVEVAAGFDEFISSHFGIANSFNRAKEILNRFQTLTTTSYTVWKREKTLVKVNLSAVRVRGSPNPDPISSENPSTKIDK